jgi:hypothetical protein
VVRRQAWRATFQAPPLHHSIGATTSELNWRSGDGQTGRSLKARATCFQVKSSTSLLDQRQRPTASRSPAGKAPRRSLGRCLGQAVTGGSLVWRRRRLRGVLSVVVVVVVVDPGLRPRFFSVLPTPANFRSR